MACQLIEYENLVPFLNYKINDQRSQINTLTQQLKQEKKTKALQKDQLNSEKEQLNNQIRELKNQLKNIKKSHKIEIINKKKEFEDTIALKDSTIRDLRNRADHLATTKNQLEHQLSQLQSQQSDNVSKLATLDLIDKELITFVNILEEKRKRNIIEQYQEILREEEVLHSLKNMSQNRFVSEIDQKEEKYLELNTQITTVSLNERSKCIEERLAVTDELSQSIQQLNQQLFDQLDILKYNMSLMHQYNHSDKKQSVTSPLYLKLIESQNEYNHALTQLRNSIEPYKQVLVDIEDQVRHHIQSNQYRFERHLTVLEKKQEATYVLIERYQKFQQHVKNRRESFPISASLISDYKELTDQRESVIADLSDINSQIIRSNQKVNNEELEDEIRNKARDNKNQKLIEYETKSLEKTNLSKRLQQIERSLYKYSELGEVDRLIKLSTDRRSIEDYTLVKQIGGRKSNVALYKRLGEHCVLKSFLTGTDHSMLRREASIRSLPKFPLIVPVNSIFRVGEVAYVETPYITGGTLRDWIQKEKRSVLEIQNMIRLIAQAINYLHSHDMIHCDLKPENILIRKIGETCTPMLCDFELTRNKDSISTNTTFGGSTNYMAPVSTIVS
jgi:hypothetical protein